MKLNQLLETTLASMPEPGQEPFRSGRNEESLEETCAGGTVSGSVASVSKPLGKMRKRVEEQCESCDCPKSKCGCNESVNESSILQGIIEADLQETDFILNPNKGRKFKPGLLTKQIGTPNPADNVRIDIPLLIRLLEYAREDAGSDLDLHDLAEKLVMCGARGKVLTMRDYEKLVDNSDIDENSNPEYDDEAGMADNNLETLRRAIDGIDEIIQPDDNLPEWCQEKIAIAKSSLINVWDYMKSEEDRMEESDLGEDWQKTNRKDKTSGMSRKAVKQYRRENPGSKLQTAVTTKPSKLKKGSKAANRRKSFCARMSGMKKSRTSAKTKRDPNSNINKALRRWNCESVEDLQNLVLIAEQKIAETKQRLDPKCWSGYKKQGTKMKGGVRVNNCVPKESVEEASSPAQQAAIAIAKKKKAGVKEGLRDPKDNPCWKGYKPVGTKKKAGKTVPNCVPKESVEESFSKEQLAAALSDYLKKGGEVKVGKPSKGPRKPGYSLASKHIGGGGDKMRPSRTGRASNPIGKPVVAVEEEMVQEQRIHSKLIKILQQSGFQGPFKVSETPWAEQFGDVSLPDDQIMIQGTDVQYDAWVLNPAGDYGYYFGQESGYQSGNAQQVVSWLKTVI